MEDNKDCVGFPRVGCNEQGGNEGTVKLGEASPFEYFDVKVGTDACLEKIEWKERKGDAATGVSTLMTVGAILILLLV